MSGVGEESAEFARPINFKTADRFRRIAGIGPAYEAPEDRRAFVVVIESDEEFDSRKAGAELDPPA